MTRTLLRHLMVATSILILTGCVSAASIDQGRQYRFVNHGLLSGTHGLQHSLLTIDTSRNLVGIGDDFETIRACDAESEFRCFRANMLAFGVPMKDVNLPVTWELGDLRFRRSDSIEIHVLGRSEVVYRIDALSNGRVKYAFYFGCERGLRAVVMPLGFHDQASVYFSVDEVGPYARTCGATH